jgi:two-component system, cell cycle sensor histidine kinase and response regulator CckA
VDVNAVVRDTHKLLRRLIGEDIELVTLPANAPANIIADPGQLEQVLTNLAANARDAMPEGGTLMITVGLTEDLVTLRVTDSGSGMSEEVRTRALEPFFTTKASGKGTGLGLSTCHTIVEQSGGRLDIESRPGAGTTFVINFPRTHLAVAQRLKPESVPPPRAHGETILVVEDDAQVRAVVAQLLRDHGFRVLEADNGGDGLEVIRNRGRLLACVVTDVIMPILSGGPLVTTIRRELPDLPIIVISGYVDDPMLRDDLRRSNVEFLAKPFTAEQLIDKVFVAMERAGDEQRREA